MCNTAGLPLECACGQILSERHELARPWIVCSRSWEDDAEAENGSLRQAFASLLSDGIPQNVSRIFAVFSTWVLRGRT